MTKEISFILDKVEKLLSLRKELPKEDVIIIDEIGLCNKEAQDVIYKCFVV